MVKLWWEDVDCKDLDALNITICIRYVNVLGVVKMLCLNC